MNDKITALSDSVIRYAQSMLVVKLRFMDMAISSLAARASDVTETICTNGQFVYYSPRFVLKCYKQCATFPTRQYLHVIFHCVFRHFFVNTLVDKQKWNVACDIAVENALLELGLDCVTIPNDAERIRNKQTEKRNKVF